tara:strand:- start:362 stop:502 length:141 start_codon:yes stop_codon:yes gene_type:complete
MIIYKIENTYNAQIIKRPSKICKTPYVADIIIENKEFIRDDLPINL